MKNRIGLSVVGAILLFAATTALVLAWPNQPPDKVLIGGPGIEGQVEVTDESAREIFRLGVLEDLDDYNADRTVSVQAGTGYKIVRFFYGGQFNFAQLTYYRNPSGGRGYLFWEDGPDLTGDGTAYNKTWLYTKPDAEQKLRALLKQLGAKLDETAPADDTVGSPASAKANASSDPARPRGAPQRSQANAVQTTAPSGLAPFSPVMIGLLLGAVGMLGTAGLFLVRRGRHIEGEQ
jgi:hypothetical protein